MNFIAKLVGKCFRYFMLFALILIGFESVNVFLQGQAGFFELLATLAMLYLIYKFLVPLAERFLVFFTKANVAPQQRQEWAWWSALQTAPEKQWAIGSWAPALRFPAPLRIPIGRRMSGPGGNIRQRIGPSSMKVEQGLMPGPMMAMWHPTGPSRPERMPNDNDWLPEWAKK